MLASAPIAGAGGASTSSNSSATTAAEAAAAAEFASKKFVWIPDRDAGYLSAWIVKQDDAGTGSVTVALSDGTQRTLPFEDTSNQNPPRFELSDNIADLTFLSEASVSHCIRQRYQRNLIYTYSGLFLVAVNPYQQLPIYTDAYVADYKGRRREERPPHVYAVADEAMRNMLDHRENQSLLITGESGAGKTENTKKVIQYLAAVASDMNAASLPTSSSSGSASLSRSESSRPGVLTRSGSSRYVMDRMQGIEAMGDKKLGELEAQILQANPILEAFGNAQTIRNNNSSRFGKFVRIEFTSTGAIAGANIDWYLLEKSRVHNRSEKERSFHVFYQLLRSGDRDLLAKLLLTGNPADYAYLKSSRQNVEGLDDGEEWHALKKALDTVKLSEEEQLQYFRIVASILLIGNIELADDRSGAEQARINNTAHIEKVCHLLGVPEQELTKALLRPRVKAGREWVTQSRTRRQVLEEMAALSKTMYEKTFAAIVERINSALDRKSSRSTFIGVLDIAGFEIFETNSFEQLCINYTNEKLQQFFNHHMFVLEQEEYARENIEWDFVNFGLDLQPTIDLIESTAPVGILSCLDEECIMPKATDETFTEKCNSIWATKKDGSALDEAAAQAAAERGVAHGSTKYISARFATGFTIRHYAGNVEYRTEGWLDKNKDPLNDNLTRVMSESTDSFIAQLFADFAPEDDFGGASALPSSSTQKSKLSDGLAAAGGGAAPSPRKRRVKRGAFRTLAQKHKEQLTSLMNQLGSTQPHFVRCIVPNAERKPGKMQLPLVLEQLRCNGVLEGIRIARLGYPNRLLFNEFRTRYEVLTPDIIPRGYMDGRKACQRMVEAMSLDAGSFKIGLTKIFFRAGVLAELEERRDRLLYGIFARFQAACRMFTARRQLKKRLNRAAAARTIQRNARLYVELREWPWWQLYTKVRPLLTATRHDEELKRKELELAMITERAERDQREREALEALKFSLESEKAKIEEQLASERELLADKDRLLARSKERESALEDDLAAMQADVDQLDSQLERAMAAHKAAEGARSELQTAFDQAAEHLLRLEASEKEWKTREGALTAEVGDHSANVAKLTSERDLLHAAKADLERKVKESGEDLDRHQKRLTARVAELEALLAGEQKAKAEATGKVTRLEEQMRKVEYQLSELNESAAGHEAVLKDRDAKISSLTARVAALGKDKEDVVRQHGNLKLKLETLTADFASARGESQKAVEARAQLQRELDETRSLMAAKTSEDVKQKEVQRMKEGELQSLRQQMAALQKENAAAKHDSTEQLNALRAQLDAAQKQHREASTAHADASAKLADHEKRVVEAAASLAAAEKARRATESELHAVRERATSAEGSLASHKQTKAELEKQLSGAQTQYQELEDALLELERQVSHHKTKADQRTTELAAETKRRELLESSAKQSQSALAALQQQQAARDKEFKQLRDELALTQVDLRKAQSMTNPTIVEHIRVHEEAKRLAEKQLADKIKEIDTLRAEHKTLERKSQKLKTDNEDMTRELARVQRGGAAGGGGGGGGITTYGNVAPSANGSGSGSGSAAASTSSASTRALEKQVAELTSSLRTATRERDDARSNARRSQLSFDSAREGYEARIVELERQLKGSHLAHSNTYQNLQDLVRASGGSAPGSPSKEASGSSSGSGSGSGDGALRRKLLEELRLGHDALEADIAAKSDMLRSHGHAANGVVPPSKSKAGGGATSPRGSAGSASARERTMSAASTSTGTAASGRPSWASSTDAVVSAATQRGTTVITPSAIASKRRSAADLALSSHAHPHPHPAVEENARLEQRVKELQIEQAALGQNCAEAQRRAESAARHKGEVEAELVRVREWARQLEGQVHRLGGAGAVVGASAHAGAANGLGVGMGMRMGMGGA